MQTRSTTDEMTDTNQHDLTSTPLTFDSDKTYYKVKESDYCHSYTTDGQTFGACEIQGWRDSQEDALCTSTDAVKGFDQLPYEAQEIALSNTINKMHALYGQHKEVGSTACAATAWLDADNMLHITTANLGDSSAYVVILDKDNEIKHEQRLNVLHKPDLDSEKKRIHEEGGRVFRGYMNSALSLSRALGDTEQDNKGISHIPDITTFTRQLSDGDRAFVVTACDGMDKVASNVGKIVREHHDENSALIAHALVTAALYKHSRDNISANVFCVGNVPASATVLDGHGGDDVSTAVKKSFYAALKLEVDNVATPEKLAAAKEKYHAEKAARQAEKARKEENIRVINAKLASCLSDVENTQNYHLFFTPREKVSGEGHYNEAALIFASEVDDRSIANQIKALAKNHDLNTLSYSTFKVDGHPQTFRLEISFNEKEGIPDAFDTFLSEAKALLIRNKLLTQPPVEQPTLNNESTLFATATTSTPDKPAATSPQRKL